MVSSWPGAAVRAWASPAARASGSRVEPCTRSEHTIAAAATTTTRSRCGSAAPLAVVRGMDNAAASGTTPRVPAQETTAGTAQSGRRAPRRASETPPSGNTHATRVTISVVVTASAGSSHCPVLLRARVSVGSCRPIRLNTTLSSTKMRVW